MGTILVSYASKMGATAEIAEAVCDGLTTAGLGAQLCDAAAVTSVARYDAVVLGSALYVSKWRPDAMTVLKLLAAEAGSGHRIPSWLFQSGPCGKDSDTAQVPAPRRVVHYATLIGASTPITFGGRLEPATAKGFLARWMASNAMAGDYRDFDRIRVWTDTIAAQLTTPRTLSTPG